MSSPPITYRRHVSPQLSNCQAAQQFSRICRSQVISFDCLTQPHSRPYFSKCSQTNVIFASANSSPSSLLLSYSSEKKHRQRHSLLFAIVRHANLSIFSVWRESAVTDLGKETCASAFLITFFFTLLFGEQDLKTYRLFSLLLYIHV